MARHRKARLWFALHCAQIITSELRAKDLEFMKGISERLGKDKQRAGSNPQTKKERMPKAPRTVPNRNRVLRLASRMYGCCVGGARREWEEEVASVAKIVKFLEDGHEIRNGMDQWTTKVALLTRCAAVDGLCGAAVSDHRRRVQFALSSQVCTQDVAYLNDYSLLTAKPVVYVINLSEDDYKRKKNKWLAKIHAWVTVSRCLSAGCR